MPAKYAAIGLILSLLAACAGPQKVRQNWPSSIPPVSHFEQIYQADSRNQSQQTLDDYLRWVKNFYQGWDLYRKGWNDFVPKVLGEFDDPQTAREMENQLNDLGREIAGEWGKYDELRRIKSRHLSVWANAMRQAMGEGNVREVIDDIEQDVDALLNERLAGEKIDESRYFKQKENDVFRSSL